MIVPLPTLRDNEVVLSYQTFLELFKYKIIYYLMKLEDIRLGKAYTIWKNAVKFDQRVYDIMQFIIKHCDAKVLINRNPTLNFYSILRMDIKSVTPTDSDFTLSVN